MDEGQAGKRFRWTNVVLHQEWDLQGQKPKEKRFRMDNSICGGRNYGEQSLAACEKASPLKQLTWHHIQ